MENQAAQPPLMVCRHCSVASRTDDASCPSCGRPYQRSLWRWWLAIPIVALAFAAGYFGISRLFDDDNPAGITAAEAAAIEPGISLADLEDQLGEDPQYTRDRGQGQTAASCAYYGVSDAAGEVWEFCFRDDKLITSTAIGGAPDKAVPTAPTAPAPAGP